MNKLTTRKIIHIDMDCFYAAIEMRDDPTLQEIPLAVGGQAERRGVICTCNYKARQYGVRSAMASAYALTLCPNLKIIYPNMQKYKQESEKIKKIFYEYTDIIEPLSLDEAFLDVSHQLQFQGSATYIAKSIRDKIQKERQLTASAGIAPNKFLAKIASDWHKPNGQFVIPPDKIAAFVYELPVEKIFGVGKVTKSKLHNLGLYHCGDIQQIPHDILIHHFGRFGQVLYELARGIDEREVQSYRTRKSLSVEHTYAEDISDMSDIAEKIVTLFEELDARLHSHQDKLIKNNFVKIKFDDFQTTTVTEQCSTIDLLLFQRLFQKGYSRHPHPIRLLGLGVGFLQKSPENNSSTQLSLF